MLEPEENEKQLEMKDRDLFRVFALFLILLFILYRGPVPVFAEMFQEFDKALPPLTKAILGTAENLSNYLWIWIPGLIGLVYSLRLGLAKLTRGQSMFALRVMIGLEGCLAVITGIGMWLPMQIELHGVVGG